MKSNVFSFLCLFLACIACTENDYSPRDTDKLNALYGEHKTEEDKTIQEYASVLAQSLVSQDVRLHVKNEVLKRFDGDYDCLASVLNASTVGNTKRTLASILKDEKHNANILDDFDTSIGKIKNLQVSVPLHCEEWDVESHIPLVVFLPYSFDDTKNREVPAYDHKGNITWLSLDVEPSVPVVVVSQSERVDKNGVLINTYDQAKTVILGDMLNGRTSSTTPSSVALMHADAGQIILRWPDVDDETGYFVDRKIENQLEFSQIASLGMNQNVFVNSGLTPGTKVWYKIRSNDANGPSASSPIVGSRVSGRNEGEALTINKMYFTKDALKAVESWTAGAPELRLRVVVGSASLEATTVFTSGRMEPSKRSNIENQWWYKTVSIVSWAPNEVGTVLTFNWREEDTLEAKLDFSIGASYEDKIGENGPTIKAGGSVSITNDPSKGGDIGTKQVHWWDTKTNEYDITGFKWTFQ